MERRRFLSSLLGLAAVPVAAKLPVAPFKKYTATVTPLPTVVGFGISAVKKEGGTVLYDTNFPRALWPGISKLFGEHYEKLQYERE
jgi:hypothetical protein